MKSKYSILSAFVLLAVLFSGLLIWERPESESTSSPADGTKQLQAIAADTSVDAVRPVFAFSVVPGGVYSKAELVRAVAADRLVRDHYTDLRLDRVQPQTVQKDKLAYVSFRKMGMVYWTRKPVKIAAGETVLTDGQTTVRARCGNQVSETPRMPTIPASYEEPAEGVLDSVTEYAHPEAARSRAVAPAPQGQTAAENGAPAHALGNMAAAGAMDVPPRRSGAGASSGMLGMGGGKDGAANDETSSPGSPRFPVLIDTPGQAPTQSASSQPSPFTPATPVNPALTTQSYTTGITTTTQPDQSQLTTITHQGEETTTTFNNDGPKNPPPTSLRPTPVLTTVKLNGDTEITTNETPQTVSTPEPSSGLLLCGGLLALIYWRRRQTKTA